MGNELKIQIRSSKDQFKHKLEAKFKSTNTKEAWLGLRQITGFGVKARKNNGLSTESAANELNEFYARFDKYDFSQEQEKLHSELILKAKYCDHMEITKESVVKCMGMIKPNKACGPDNIGGRFLWVQQFLTGRLQRVCLGTTRSGTIRTNTGAPQGCVIYPVLFCLHYTLMTV